nr:hypothetical protein [Haladaptatus halobius]
MTERDLAVQLTAQETEQSPSDLTEEDYQQIQMTLYHYCLPKLEATGWIERQPEGIIATERLFFEQTELSLPDIDDPDLPSWEALAPLLARPRRQHVASIIADYNQSLTLDELGTALTTSDHTTWEAEDGGNEPTLLVTLHHVDLPKLEEVGLIEYDSDEKTITQQRSLRTFVDWMDNSSSTNEVTDTNS